MFYIRNLCAHRIKARFYRQARKSAKMLVPVETLLGNGKLDLTIIHNGGGGVGVEHVEAENQHELLKSPVEIDDGKVIRPGEYSDQQWAGQSRGTRHCPQRGVFQFCTTHLRAA